MVDVVDSDMAPAGVGVTDFEWDDESADEVFVATIFRQDSALPCSRSTAMTV